MNYPQAKKINDVLTLNNKEINDEYSWLAGDIEKDEDIKAWVKAENKLTYNFVTNSPIFEEYKTNLKKLFSTGSIGTPQPFGDYLFQWRRNGDENQPVLYVKDIQKNTEKVLLNPNILNKEGTTAISWFYPTLDGKLVAYGISENGSENDSLRIINSDTLEHLPENIPDCRWSTVAWLPEKNAFFYNKFTNLGKDDQGREIKSREIYFHELGKDSLEDKLIFKVEDPTVQYSDIYISQDGKWVYVLVDCGWTKQEVYLSAFDGSIETIKFIDVYKDKPFHAQPKIYGDYIYLLTDEDAAYYKITRAKLIDINNLIWETVIENENFRKIENFKMAGGKLVINFQKNASTLLCKYNIDTKLLTNISLPMVGSVDEMYSKESLEDSNLYYSFYSFAYPTTLFRYEVLNETNTQIDQIDIDADLSNIITKQIKYMSKDGTEVSMFIVSNKNLELNGENITLLYGYGGFNISMTPTFFRDLVYWVNKGYVFAMPNIRGGGEYGKDWHNNGKLDKKQNSFDDFIAAAEYLISQDYTSVNKLAIRGGSNGGLLMGAMLTQRPDLFSAVICQVPLLDMIKFANHHIAQKWTDEYGDPNKAQDFEYIYKYSPYHNVKTGIDYPATLFMTATSDSRVDPMHARKMTALLQSSDDQNNPILFWEQSNAGHGAGMPMDVIIEEKAMYYTFIELTLK